MPRAGSAAVSEAVRGGSPGSQESRQAGVGHRC